MPNDDQSVMSAMFHRVSTSHSFEIREKGEGVGRNLEEFFVKTEAHL